MEQARALMVFRQELNQGAALKSFMTIYRSFFCRNRPVRNRTPGGVGTESRHL
jgi:hypothetical protein